jgi:hypothetical protein
MGANAQTSVPVFTSGQVLTAQQQTEINTGIPVFATSVERDAAFGGTGEKTLAEGQFAFLEDTDTTQYYDGASWKAVGVAPGLVLVATATASAVASVSIDNCFTSTYENYRIIGAFTASTGSGNVTMKLRASSTDTSANYTSQLLQASSTTVSTALNAEGTDEWYVVSFNTTGKTSSFSMDVYRPQTAQITAMTSSGLWVDVSGTIGLQTVVGRQSDATQFDGFTILFTSTNITGTIRVYGYRNS